MKQLMCSYKGNVGHLMQHWALCELLNIAGKHTSGLNFIDAHAMAPWATRRGPKKNTRDYKLFDRVLDGLPGQDSAYERAWHSLIQKPGKGELPQQRGLCE